MIVFFPNSQICLHHSLLIINPSCLQERISITQHLPGISSVYSSSLIYLPIPKLQYLQNCHSQDVPGALTSQEPCYFQLSPLLVVLVIFQRFLQTSHQPPPCLLGVPSSTDPQTSSTTLLSTLKAQTLLHFSLFSRQQ